MSTITASPASAAPQGTMPGSLDSATLDRVDALAAQMGRSRDWVLNEAITSYLDYNECRSLQLLFRQPVFGSQAQ